MMILAGYLAVLAYVFGLIFVLGPAVRRRVNLETSRKVIHTMLFMVWVLIDLFFAHTVHQIVIPVIFLILNALSFKFHIYQAVEREDENHMGTVYFAMAITAVMTAAYFWPAAYLPSGLAAFCLTFGDGFAALIGYNFRSRSIRQHKSWLGFGACFAASAAALTAFRLIYGAAIGAADVLLLALITAVCELMENGLDNFSVTFGVFALSWLMLSSGAAATAAGWWAAAVFAVVFFSHAIDYAGSLLAMVMVFVFSFCGGPAGLAYLLGTYFTIFAVGLVRKKLRPAQKKSAGRGFWQILINGGLGTLLVLLYGVYGQRWLLAAGMTAIGGCFIDSVSSDVGSLSAKAPYDFLRRCHVKPGISGGMSVLGTASSAAGSVLIGLFAWQVAGFSAAVSVAVGGLSFAQTLLDTAMGSRLQVRYRCGVCGEETEKHEHCGSPTVRISGVAWMNNNMVNLLSSAVITLLAALILPWMA